jgi:hypothetical protein
MVRRAARQAGLTEADILVGRHRLAVALRQRLWRKIHRITGCSLSGLAEVWGIDRQAICRVIERPEAEDVALKTRSRIQAEAALRFHYGDVRAAAILDGRDPATNADVARWNAIGSRRGAAA